MTYPKFLITWGCAQHHDGALQIHVRMWSARVCTSRSLAVEVYTLRSLLGGIKLRHGDPAVLAVPEV